MVLSKKRKTFQGFSFRIGKFFGKICENPKLWTGLSLFFALMGFFLVFELNFLFSGLAFLISGFLDMVDGAVARYTKKSSVKGAYIDTIMDRYVEFLAFFGLILVPLPFLLLPAYGWVVLCLFGSLMTTYSKAASKEKGIKSIEGGLLERPERIIILSVGIMLGEINRIFVVCVLILIALFTNITALQRIKKALK